jgi:hypothetical protein
VEEISFDNDARADYLTGFHKRKVERAKRAKAEAEKKMREERVVVRKQVCLPSLSWGTDIGGNRGYGRRELD